MDRSQKYEAEAPTDAEPNGEAEPIETGGEAEEEQEEEETVGLFRLWTSW